MIDLQFFTDCLLLALHLTPHAIIFASDFSAWFTNRFRTDSDTCQNVERKKQTLVFYTPHHAPLTLPAISPEAHCLTFAVPLSQHLALNQGNDPRSHSHPLGELEEVDRRPTHTTQQDVLITCMSQDSHPWTTNGNLTLTRYRSTSNTHFKA